MTFEAHVYTRTVPQEQTGESETQHCMTIQYVSNSTVWSNILYTQALSKNG